MKERADKDMMAKSQKHEMIEKMRFEELNRREEEFERKREKIEKLRRDQEIEEIRAVSSNLRQFEFKLKESNEKHSYQL
jgi:hypothetical protein